MMNTNNSAVKVASVGENAIFDQVRNVSYQLSAISKKESYHSLTES